MKNLYHPLIDWYTIIFHIIFYSIFVNILFHFTYFTLQHIIFFNIYALLWFEIKNFKISYLLKSLQKFLKNTTQHNFIFLYIFFYYKIKKFIYKKFFRHIYLRLKKVTFLDTCIIYHFTTLNMTENIIESSSHNTFFLNKVRIYVWMKTTNKIKSYKNIKTLNVNEIIFFPRLIQHKTTE